MEDEECGHPDAWFRVTVRGQGDERIICFTCVQEQIQELPLGWSATVERVGN
jgi:hypothetical protein